MKALEEIRAESDTAPERVRARDPLYMEILEFLYDEALLLDHNKLLEWQEILAEDLQYRMPVRVTRRRSEGLGFDDKMAHLDETAVTIAYRIRRITQTQNAWAEDPPSRTRRFVTNAVVHRTEVANEFSVMSYLLMTRSRWDQPTYEFVSAERQDLIRMTDDGFKLARRTIYIDQSTLMLHNVAIFL